MSYLIAFHWAWLFVALILGVIVGWWTYQRARARWMDGLVWIVVACIALAALVAISTIILGAAGYWLELAVLMVLFYVVGCPLGWALRHLALVEPASESDVGGLPKPGYTFPGLVLGTLMPIETAPRAARTGRSPASPLPAAVAGMPGAVPDPVSAKTPETSGAAMQPPATVITPAAPTAAASPSTPSDATFTTGTPAGSSPTGATAASPLDASPSAEVKPDAPPLATAPTAMSVQSSGGVSSAAATGEAPLSTGGNLAAPKPSAPASPSAATAPPPETSVAGAPEPTAEAANSPATAPTAPITGTPSALAGSAAEAAANTGKTHPTSPAAPAAAAPIGPTGIRVPVDEAVPPADPLRNAAPTQSSEALPMEPSTPTVSTPASSQPAASPAATNPPAPSPSVAGTPSAASPPKMPPLPNEDRHPGARPDGLLTARDDKADDLKWIKGIGPQNEGRLHGLGVWHFDQIAAWTPDNVKWVGSYLAFHGRIDREKWIEQAKVLEAGRETAFAKRVVAGKVASSHDDGSHGQKNIDASVKPGPRRR